MYNRLGQICRMEKLPIVWKVEDPKQTNFFNLFKLTCLSNFRPHHFKSVGYRNLAHIRKSMQIRKPFVHQTKKLP